MFAWHNPSSEMSSSPWQLLNAGQRTARQSTPTCTPIMNRKFLSSFKTQQCPHESSFHDHRMCSFYHKNKRDYRRNPYKDHYDINEVNNEVERRFHPTVYKTSMCNSMQCKFMKLCSKAHSVEELVSSSVAVDEYAESHQVVPKSSYCLASFLPNPSRVQKKKPATLVRWEGPCPSPSTSNASHVFDRDSLGWFMISTSEEMRLDLKNIALREGLCKVEIRRNSWSESNRPCLTIRGINAQVAFEIVMDLLKTPPPKYFVSRTQKIVSDRVRDKLVKKSIQNDLVPSHHQKRVKVCISASSITVYVKLEKGCDSNLILDHIFGSIDFWIHTNQYNKFQECICCLEQYNSDQGLTCNGCSSFYCSVEGCLGNFVESIIPSIQSQSGNVMCQCKEFLDVQEIGKHITRDKWEKLQNAIVACEVKKEYEKLQCSFDDRLAQMVNELMEKHGNLESFTKKKAELNAAKARNESLNLKCPHCHTVYLDFVGCMALVCETCKKHLCAYCHQKCETSRGTHDHVRGCLMNETPQASYYANAEEIKNAQRRFRTREVKKFLQHFKKEEQNATIIELQIDLKDLGIDPASLFEFGGELHQR